MAQIILEAHKKVVMMWRCKLRNEGLISTKTLLSVGPNILVIQSGSFITGCCVSNKKRPILCWRDHTNSFDGFSQENP